MKALNRKPAVSVRNKKSQDTRHPLSPPVNPLKSKRRFPVQEDPNDYDSDPPATLLGIRLEECILPTLIALRLFNALLIQTTFAPDEVWQSVEVAHKWVFGYGALSWEWQPSVAIRSPLYPLIFSGIFKALAMFNLDSREAIILAPRLFHGFLTGVTDYMVYKMALNLSGQKSANWVLLAELTSWFVAYCGPRSLSNSLEWSLHAAAFLYYPWDPATGVNRAYASPALFLLTVCVCVILRPTAAVLWAPVCLHYLYRKWRKSWQKVGRTALLGALIGIPCLAYSICVDRLVYGRWTVNQVNFLRFNLFSNGADFYGTESWHWYLTNGIPTMLTCHLPLAAIGWIIDAFTQPTGIHWLMEFRDLSRPPELRAERNIAKIFGLWFDWTVFAYSCLGHKEFRFLFPMMPIFVFYTGRGLLHLNRALRKRKFAFICSPMALITGLLIVTNVLVAGYTCTVHQRGPNELMKSFGVKADAENWSGMAEKPRVLALMPCHTIPYLSYLHHNIDLRLLACDPDLCVWRNQTDAHYVDEAEVFYADPRGWLTANYDSAGSSLPLPHYIAMFTHLLLLPPQQQHRGSGGGGDDVVKWLEDARRKYRPCAKIFHAHFFSHARHSSHIVVWCAPGWNLTSGRAD